MYTIIEDSDFDGPCAAPPQDAIAQGMSTPLATLGLLLISVSIALGIFGIDSRRTLRAKYLVQLYQMYRVTHLVGSDLLLT